MAIEPRPTDSCRCRLSGGTAAGAIAAALMVFLTVMQGLFFLGAAASA